MHKIIYFQICAVLFFTHNLFSQSFINTDSILKVAKTATKITESINALNSFAYELRRKDPETGNRIADSTYKITKTINYKEGEADYYALKGTFLFASDLDSSKYFFNKSISIFKQLGNRNMKLSRAYCSIATTNIYLSNYDSCLYYSKLSNSILTVSDFQNDKRFYYRVGMNFKVIGDAYYYLGVLDSSMNNYMKAEQILNYTGDLNATSICLIGLSCVLSLNNQYDKAIEKLKIVIRLEKELKNYQNLNLAYSNIGNFLCYSKNFKEANKYIDSAMTLGREKNLYRNLSSNYLGLGFIAMQQKECKKALSLFIKGLKLATENENEFIKKGLNVSIGEAFYCLNDSKNAIIYFEESLKSKDTFKDNQLQAYKGLSDCYEKIKDLGNAFFYLKKYNSLNDSLYNLEKNNAINNLENKYEVKEKEKEINFLSMQNNIGASNTKQEYVQKLIVISILILVILVSIILFRKYRISKIIEEQEAINKERIRIARDLHDDLGATISSISIYSSAVKQKLTDKNIKETERILDRISEDAQEMVTGMSDMVWAISPENNTVEKLTDRLHSYGSGLMQLKEIQFTLHCKQAATNTRLSLELRKNIFLIFKEAINNAVKYSDASRANLNVFFKEAFLIFEISDNGKGFDIEKYESATGGNGLKNMEQRAKEINAELIIQSNSDRGTVIKLTISLPKNGEN